MGVESGSDLYVLNGLATSAQGDTDVVTTRRRILRSTDHGQTWEAVYNELPDIHPHRPIHLTQVYHHPWSMQHLFVTAHRNNNSLRKSGHLYVLVSHDGGDSWDYLRVDDHSPTLTYSHDNISDDVSWDFAADPKNPNIFWVQVERTSYRDSVDHLRRIFRTADGGQTWVRFPVMKHEGALWWADNDTRARSIHVHPTKSDTLLLGYSYLYVQEGQLSSDGDIGATRIYYNIPDPDVHDGFKSVQEPFSGHQRHDKVAYTWNI